MRKLPERRAVLSLAAVSVVDRPSPAGQRLSSGCSPPGCPGP